MGYALRRMWLPQRVASLLWNQWQLCRGMRGKFAMESVATFARNTHPYEPIQEICDFSLGQGRKKLLPDLERIMTY